MATPRIRIKLRAYDHEILDASAREIVDHVTRTGARVVGPVPLPTERNVFTVWAAGALANPLTAAKHVLHAHRR